MACTQPRFFGVPLVTDQPDDMAEIWGCERSTAGLLIFADRMLMWRIARSRPMRQYLLDVSGHVAPNARGLSRQIRTATGCRVGPFPEFQTVVRIMSRAEADEASVYLIGRSQDQLQRVEQNVRATFPRLRVVGRAVFHPSATEAITTAIRKADPRIIYVGSDAPMLFRWLLACSSRFGTGLVVVGYRSAQRMAGRARTLRKGVWLAWLVRPFLWPVLLVHRFIVHRRRSKQTS